MGSNYPLFQGGQLGPVCGWALGPDCPGPNCLPWKNEPLGLDPGNQLSRGPIVRLEKVFSRALGSQASGFKWLGLNRLGPHLPRTPPPTTATTTTTTSFANTFYSGLHVSMSGNDICCRETEGYLAYLQFSYVTGILTIGKMQVFCDWCPPKSSKYRKVNLG